MSTVCRYSRNCRRPDCYFAHPEGRLIETSGPGGRGQNPGHHEQNSHAHNGGGNKNPAPCRFDRQCKRPECYFSHPNGREIDEMYYGGQQQHQPQPQHSPPNTSSHGSPNAAMNRSFEQFVRHHEEERHADETMMENLERFQEESDRQDEWVVASRDCSCCKGFAYGCKDPTCMSLGVCGCIAETELGL